ncbi:MAG TPA: 3-deoxy-D-manno-octulosonic acid transferase [Beijerinckiaceae bacterium]|jgi:3-deoxy-D-manno-octulosonic-acid transferase
MSARVPPPLVAYRIGLSLLEPAALGLLAWRRRRGKEDPARIGERRGIPGRLRPEGVPLVWVHGASLGETLAVLPVVERLAQQGLAVLVTSGTRTSAELVARRLPPGAAHQYVPLDVPRYVARFLDHWRPDLALFAESEIWPNMLLALDRRGIPRALLNARLSERSFARWQRFPDIAGSLLAGFALCLAQSEEDGRRLLRLGAPRVSVVGNLKFDAPAPPADPREVARLSGLVAGRPLWVAASTHPGEEAHLAAAHRALAPRHPRLLTIVAPRHPHRGDEVAGLAAAEGLTTAQRSRREDPHSGTDLYIADTVGELGLFYRLSPLVFMGGSLVPHGGQNPIEAAKLGSALLHGPHVHNFTAIFSTFDGAGGALEVPDGEGLTRALGDLLADPGLVRDMARAAGEVAAEQGGALERTLRAIDPLLPRVALGAAG